MSHDKEKQLVAKEAVKLIKPGMTIGIGSGTTSAYFIQALKERVQKEHLKITCIATSIHSKELIGGSIPLIDESLKDEIDITFDGADRIDLKTFHLIKGGGGALLREKLVAAKSKQNIVLVDYSKVTSPLQGFPVALEIVKFGHESTLQRLKKLGYEGKLRKSPSDNDNYIYDIDFKGAIENPEKHHTLLKSLLGVIETGLFLNTATKAYIAQKDGTVKIVERP